MGDVTAILLALAVATGAFAQSVTGIGLALVGGPAMFMVLGPIEGVRVMLVLSLVFSVSYLLRHWRQVLKREALRLLVPGAVATVPTAIVFRAVDARAAAVVAGLGIVVAVVVVARGYVSPWLATAPGAVVAGAVSGAMNSLSSNAGPVAVLYGRNARWPLSSTTATLQAYYVALNLVTIPSMGLPRSAAVLPLGVAAMAVGLLAGLVAAPRMPPELVRGATLVLAGAGGGATVVVALM